MPITEPQYKGVSKGGLTVTLAGVNITSFVDESSIDISDTLGQGPGTGSASSGRASTITINTTLGPLAGSGGSGTRVTTPTMVRNGELIVLDANGNRVWGGFAVKYTDATELTRVYTKIEGHDYYQVLSRTNVNEVYSGETDIFIIKDLLRKYAPWVDTSQIPALGGFQFPNLTLRNITLMDALNKITDTTGYMAWIDYYKRFRYVPPTQASSAPFALSDKPDFRSSFQLAVSDYEIDDTSIINRVYFYGGKKLSDDLTQDLSPQANGSNAVFVLAYYPHNAKDGKVHVKVNGGADLVLGNMGGTGKANTLKSAGGSADVILNSDGHTITFSTAPAIGATVTCKYRFEQPLIVVVTDQTSFHFFGTYYDGTISDESIFDNQQAVQRCRILLAEQSFGLTTFKVICWKAGIKSGQLLNINHTIRNIHGTYIVQEVHTTALGNGQFQYELTLGAWRWNAIDVLKAAAFASQAADSNTDESSTPVQIQQAPVNVNVALIMSLRTAPHGGYYARLAPVGDTHDPYPGFFTITS